MNKAARTCIASHSFSRLKRATIASASARRFSSRAGTMALLSASEQAFRNYKHPNGYLSTLLLTAVYLVVHKLCSNSTLNCSCVAIRLKNISGHSAVTSDPECRKLLVLKWASQIYSVTLYPPVIINAASSHRNLLTHWLLPCWRRCSPRWTAICLGKLRAFDFGVKGCRQGSRISIGPAL